MLKGNQLGAIPVILLCLHIGEHFVELFEELLRRLHHAFLVLILLACLLNALLLVFEQLFSFGRFLACNLLVQLVERILDGLTLSTVVAS